MPRIDRATRDRNIIEHILRYCDDIAAIHREFQTSKESFLSSRTYQHAIGMCILQIGELVKHLSSEFVMAHPEIEWSSTARARDFYAHQYGHVDFDIAWETATVSCGKLADFCRNLPRS